MARPHVQVPVPTQLFQGSLLLGGVTRLALGEAALRAAEVRPEESLTNLLLLLRRSLCQAVIVIVTAVHIMC